MLLKMPLATNMLSTGFLFGTGDCLAQNIGDGDYDYSRTLRAVIYGGIIFAPMGDRWYKIIDKVKFPNRSITPKTLRVYDTILKVGLDQLVFAPFVGIPLYYTMMTFFEFRPTPIQEAQRRIHVNWWETLKTNWLVWPTFQLFNFGLIPVQLRLLLVNIISIGWNCYLSYVLNRRHDTNHP